jgi:hypothetical protein
VRLYASVPVSIMKILSNLLMGLEPACCDLSLFLEFSVTKFYPKIANWTASHDNLAD